MLDAIHSMLFAYDSPDNEEVLLKDAIKAFKNLSGFKLSKKHTQPHPAYT